MRVASVNQDRGIAPGRAKGAAVHLEAMRAAFAERGDDVVAIDASDEARLLLALGVAQAQRPIDLLYERYALGRAAAARYASHRGIPYVVEVNAPLAEEARLWRGAPDSPADRVADRELFGAASLVVAVSTSVARYAIARGAAPERIQVVPNAVDPRHFSPARRLEWGAAPPVPARRFVVGFHGRLRPWHGLELVAGACGELVARGVDLHFVAVGEGDFDAALGAALEPARRTAVGWLPHDEVGRWVALFDAAPLGYAAGLPCYFSPLKLAEAMASGAVPVVPACGDLPDLVGSTGLVYPAGDRNALVRALHGLALDPDRRERLAAAAVRRASERSWRDVVELIWSRFEVRVPA